MCVGSGEGEGGGWLEKRYLGKREGAGVRRQWQASIGCYF